MCTLRVGIIVIIVFIAGIFRRKTFVKHEKFILVFSNLSKNIIAGSWQLFSKLTDYNFSNNKNTHPEQGFLVIIQFILFAKMLIFDLKRHFFQIKLNTTRNFNIQTYNFKIHLSKHSFM